MSGNLEPLRAAIDTKDTALIVHSIQALFRGDTDADPGLGYQLAAMLYQSGLTRTVFYELFRAPPWEPADNRRRVRAFQDRVRNALPIDQIGITEGPLIQINPAGFPEERPVLAYCDDVGPDAVAVENLALLGTATFEARSFMWLGEERHGLLFQVIDGSKPAQLLSTSVGEFCLDVHHARQDGGFVLLFEEDYVLK